MWPTGRLDLIDGTWVWEGGPVAMVNERYLHQYGNAMSRTVFQCGDYRIRILREEFPDFRLFVALDTWYTPFIVFWDKLSRSARTTKAFIIRMAIIWGLGVYPGEGCRLDDWNALRPVRWIRQLSRHKFHRWFLKKWAQLHDLSIRPFGYRFLSVAKGDYKCTVYLNDSDIWPSGTRTIRVDMTLGPPEDGVFEAKVPNEPGVWGWGWVHKNQMEGNRCVMGQDGKPIAYYKYGHVMWREGE